jgi:hypothetical protein
MGQLDTQMKINKKLIRLMSELKAQKEGKGASN